MAVSSIVSGTKDVTTAGTEVRLSDSHSVPAIEWVVITASPANTGRIVVGDSSIVATSGSERGIVLGPGDSVTLPINDIRNVYIDSTVNGEGVSFLAGAN